MIMNDSEDFKSRWIRTLDLYQRSEHSLSTAQDDILEKSRDIERLIIENKRINEKIKQLQAEYDDMKNSLAGGKVFTKSDILWRDVEVIKDAIYSIGSVPGLKRTDSAGKYEDLLVYYHNDLHDIACKYDRKDDK